MRQKLARPTMFLGLHVTRTRLMTPRATFKSPLCDCPFQGSLWETKRFRPSSPGIRLSTLLLRMGESEPKREVNLGPEEVR